MQTSRFIRTWCMMAALAVAVTMAATESNTITPDFAGMPSEHGWKLINRSAALIDKAGATAVHLEGKDGTGFVRLENFTFADGVIEFDARGKNVVQQSFVGVAFHGADVRTYDAIYFRPFNFRSDDPARGGHAVQYISPPTHTWQKLREQFPGKYENAVTPVPDPNGWFHARIVVAWPKVSVFVNDAKEPSLVVNQLGDRRRGWLALWVDVSGGDFANLKITPAPTP
jgi:hypothetical protein